MARRKQNIIASISKIRLSWKLWLALWIIALALPISLKIFLKPNEAEAGWWNPSWQYRKRIDITNNESSDLTDFQISFTLDTSTLITAGKMQSDCDDIRITDYNGATLPFWIEENNPGCNSATTRIWTKVPNIPASNGNVYVYYGNSAAENQSNLSDTMIMAETNIINNVDSNWQQVNFSHQYLDPVVIPFYYKSNNTYEFSPRIKNISPLGFQIRLESASQYTSTASADDIHYLVMEKGQWLTADGKKIESNYYNTSNVGSSLNSWPPADAKTYSFTYSTAPIVFDQVVTANDTSWISSWSSATSDRQNPPDTSGFQIGLNGAQVTDTHGEETINYVVIEGSVTGNSTSGDWETGSTTDIVTESCYSITFQNTYSSAPVAIATQSKIDGSDGGWEVGCSLSASALGVFSQEDTITDTETSHTSEIFSYFAIANTGDFPLRKYTASLPTTSTASEETTPGPAAIWHLDEGSGQVKDSASHANNSTTMTADWADESQCISGKCLQFSETSDEVIIPDSTSLSPTTGVTIQGWFKITADATDTGQSYVSMIQKDGGYSGYGNYGLRLTNQNTLQALLVYGTGVDERGSMTTTSTLEKNKWYFITMTYDYDTTTWKLFINNKQELSSTTAFTNQIFDSSEVFRIGKGDGRYFHGFIDEVAVYPYARTAEQIAVDYNHGLASSQGAIDQGPLSDGLIGYWKMDEASWNGTSGEVIDASGNGNHLTSSGGTTTSSGKYGNGGIFDGSNDYLTLSTFNSNQLSQGTISTWIKTTESSSPGNKRLVEYGNAGNRIGLLKMDNKISLYALSGSTVYCGDQNYGILSNTLINDGQWHHIVGTYGSNGGKLYIDGQLENSSDTDCNMNNLPTSENLYIGEYIGGGTYYFTGGIDEARLYNRALSAREVTDLYHYAPGPVGYWKMDEGSGTTANDSSGNGLNGTLVSSPSWVTGKFGKALDFKSSNTYVTIDDNDKLDITHAVTLSSWVKFNNISNYTTILGKRDTSLTEANYVLRTNSPNNDELDFYFYANSNWQIYTTSNADLQNDIWYHISVTYDGTDVKIYINGQLKQGSCTTGTCNVPLVADTNSLAIGRPGDANQQYLNALIDEVRIYNYARTQQQIVQDMNAGHPAGGSPVGSQVAYWKFDEGYGQTANDSVGNNDGTLGASSGSGSDDPTWATASECKFDKCLNFGTGDYANMGNPTDGSLNIGEGDFTMSAWVKTSDATLWKFIQQKGATSVGSKGYSWSIQASGVQTLRITNGTFRSEVSSSTHINDGQWHHLLVTADRDENATFYVDGVKDKQVDISSSAGDASSTTNFYLSRPESDNQMIGYVDEFKLYSSILTEEQIKIDYNAGLSTGYGVAGPSEASILDDGEGNPPIAEWNFDESTGSTANDISGNGNAGTITGASWQYAGCKISSCLHFDGDGDVVENSSGANFDVDYITVEAWARFDDLTGQPAIISRDPTPRIFALYQYDATTLRFFIFTGSGSVIKNTTFTPEIGKWYHFAGVADGSEVKIYINGVDVGTPTTYSGVMDKGSVPLRIGYDPQYGSNGYFNGAIDQVKIYDYARTPAQIAYDYNRGKPIAHYRFDECQGTTINDASGNGNSGTLTIGATGSQTAAGTCSTSGAWYNGSSGKYSSSMSFDGTDDYICSDTNNDGTCDNNDNLNINGTTTYSAWVKTNDSSGQIMGGSSIGSGDFKLTLGLGGGSNPYSPAAFCSSGGEAASSTAINDGEWHHIVAIYIPSTSITIYQDGVQTAQDTSIINCTDTGNPFYIGGNGSNYFLGGQIDDVKIFNYALSADQVKQMTNEGFATRFGE